MASLIAARSERLRNQQVARDLISFSDCAEHLAETLSNTSPRPSTSSEAVENYSILQFIDARGSLPGRGTLPNANLEGAFSSMYTNWCRVV
jgi:hypothetical protein